MLAPNLMVLFSSREIIATNLYSLICEHQFDNGLVKRFLFPFCFSVATANARAYVLGTRQTFRPKNRTKQNKTLEKKKTNQAETEKSQNETYVYIRR